MIWETGIRHSEEANFEWHAAASRAGSPVIFTVSCEDTGGDTVLHKNKILQLGVCQHLASLRDS